MGEYHEWRWRTLHKEWKLPSHRVVHYWAANGVFGDGRRNVGSGNRLWFSEQELDQLEALAVLTNALQKLGFNGLPIPVVKALWSAFKEGKRGAVVELDGVSLVAELRDRG